MGSIFTTQSVEHSTPLNSVNPAASHTAGVHEVDFVSKLGTPTDNVPVSYTSWNEQGIVGGSIADDFYNVIHIKPRSAYFGIVVVPVERSFNVWNAYINESSTIEHVERENAEGVELKGVSTPLALQPLEDTSFQLAASPEGPSAIDATFNFNFTSSHKDNYIRAQGSRGVEWSIPPDWSKNVEETISFKTEILESRKGEEQRICRRHVPRQEVAYQSVLDQPWGVEARRLLATWHSQEYLMAFWPMGFPIEPTSKNSESVTLRETPREVFEEDPVALIYSLSKRAILTVRKVEGNQVYFDVPTPEEFPEGSKLYPTVPGYLEKSISAKKITNSVSSLSVRFQKSHRKRYPNESSPLKTWNDLEVFDWKPNWRENVEVDYVQEYDTLDSGAGVFKNRDYFAPEKDVYKYHFLLENYDQIDQIKLFLERVKGRQKPFYCPVWSDALSLPQGLVGSSGGSVVQLKDKDEVTRIDLDEVYRNLYVELKTGETLTGEVTDGSALSGDPYFNTTLVWPRDVYREDILGIYWMPKMRLASDDITFRWVTGGLAEVTLPLQTLPRS